MPPLTVLAIMAIFLILAFFVSRLEGLAFLAPNDLVNRLYADDHGSYDQHSGDSERAERLCFP